MSNFKNALSRLLKILFPNRCEFCGEVIEIDKSFCKDCKNLPQIKPPLCEFCGCSKKDCNCKKNKNEYKRVIAPYYYKNAVIKAIHNFKFYDMPFLCDKMACDIACCIKENYDKIDFDAICYVPLHPSSQRKRGYNQSQFLAEKVSQEINVPVLDLLEKPIKNKVQHRQSMKLRKANVFGVYDLTDKQSVKGKTILLIDDVKTTGSTLNECSKMLNIYGAKAVYCAVVAIVNNKK